MIIYTLLVYNNRAGHLVEMLHNVLGVDNRHHCRAVTRRYKPLQTVANRYKPLQAAARRRFVLPRPRPPPRAWQRRGPLALRRLEPRCVSAASSHGLFATQTNRKAPGGAHREAAKLRAPPRLRSVNCARGCSGPCISRCAAPVSFSGPRSSHCEAVDALTV